MSTIRHRRALTAGVSMLVLLPVAAGAAEIVGTINADVLTGTEAIDVISGGAGNDRILGDPQAANLPVTAVTRVARPHNAAQPNLGTIEDPVYSADGLTMAYSVVSDVTANTCSVILRSVATGAETVVDAKSNAAAGTLGLCDRVSLSANGKKLVFSSVAPLVSGDMNGMVDVHLYDVDTKVITRVSVTDMEGQGDGHSYEPVISPDGTRVAFASKATNLPAAAGADSNGKADVFVRDLVAGTTVRLSESALGVQGIDGDAGWPVFSADGKRLAFHTGARNMVTTDTDMVQDVYVRDLATKAMTRVSVSAVANQAPSGASGYPAFSPDGLEVVFQSAAENLVAGDTNGKVDVFVRDLIANTTKLVSRTAAAQADGASAMPFYSPDSSKVVFHSNATNLVTGDTNADGDWFMADLLGGAITRLSTKAAGGQVENAGDAAGIAAMSPNGLAFAYASRAIDITADGNGVADLFLATLAPGAGGRDVLRGDDGEDWIHGGGGDDLVSGGPGKDTLVGGAGIDRVSFADAAAKVTVDLATGKTSDGDKISEVEGIVGSKFDDVLKGDAKGNVIHGGPGADVMTGGGGADRFTYASLAESPAKSPDTITDFKPKMKIDLSLAIPEAKGKKKGKQKFTWIGSKPFSKKKGEVRFEKELLQIDAKGKGKATFAIKLPKVGSLKKKQVIGVK